MWELGKGIHPLKKRKSRTASRDLDDGRPRQSGFPGTNPLRTRDFPPPPRGGFGFKFQFYIT